MNVRTTNLCTRPGLCWRIGDLEGGGSLLSLALLLSLGQWFSTCPPLPTMTRVEIQQKGPAEAGDNGMTKMTGLTMLVIVTLQTLC